MVTILLEEDFFIIPTAWAVTNGDSESLTEYRSFFDFDNFYRISIPELLKKKKIGGENYIYFANHFNNISKVISFILLLSHFSQKKLMIYEKVVEIIEFFLKLMFF